MAEVIVFNNSQITNISHLFGDRIMTGSEISRVFERLGIVDNSGESTKWRRLEYAFTERQNIDNSGNAILRFIKEVLNPVNFLQRQNEFNDYCSELNGILAFSGIMFCQDGSYKKTIVAQTISDARKRVRSIVPKLRERGVHNRIIHFCNEELLAENYFHAVFEATKSLSEYIRQITGLKDDGAELYDKALSSANPYIIVENFTTNAGINRQKGLCNMLKGINSMVRNVTAHTPKINWIIDENEAVDVLLVISFLQKNLDTCQVIRMEL